MLVLSNAFLHVLSVQLAPGHPPLLGSVVVAYLGPQTVLPLASILAAAIGVVLMFWRYIAATARKVFQTRFKRSTPEAAPNSEMTEDTRG